MVCHLLRTPKRNLLREKSCLLCHK